LQAFGFVFGCESGTTIVLKAGERSISRIASIVTSSSSSASSRTSSFDFG
jgi:hypothetical protein